jgi:signal transduction histidine kinase
VERDVDEGERQHSVLVVEDTPDVARMIRLALHQEFRVLVAADGRQGLALARQHQPTVIVTDWMMPHMDGMELTRRLRDEDSTRHIPVVMLTARGDVADRVSGLETGVNAYLAKPFAASELVSTVRSQVRSQVQAVDTLLVQKMDSLEVIAGGLAHEIRNPLNYLGNALITIERDCEALLKSARGAEESPAVATDKLDTRMHKMFEVAHAGMRRIAGTVDLMVRYSREGYSRSRRAYDAYAAVRDVIDVVAPTVSRSVEIKTQLTGNGWVMCVAEELNQVLTNLVQNALEAVDEGRGVVEVRGSNDGNHLVLSVKDNGPGMSEDVRARVFDAFYTTKDVGRGLGMGLAIAQRVVTAMGGKLTLSTQLGVGSEFTIRVPSVAAGDAPA